MTTVGDAIKDALYDNWAGSGGTRPALYSTEDESMWPSDDDWIMMLGWTFVEKEKPRNDAFKGVKHYIDIRVHSRNDANKEERLDTIVTEIKRIVIPDNVTGYNLVRIIDQNRRASDRRIHSYIAELTVELILLSTSSAVTPGTGGDGDVEFPRDVAILRDLAVTRNASVGGTLGVTGATTLTGNLEVAGGTVNLTGNTSILGSSYIHFQTATAKDLFFDTGNKVYFRDQDAGDAILVQIDTPSGDVHIIGDVKTNADKSNDIGATGVAWDNVYADDFVNESPFKRIENPLTAVKAIKDKDDKLDYTTLPDWVRTFKRDHTKDKSHTMTVIDARTGEERERIVIDEIGPKSIIAERGYSMNRMIVLLYQALQEAGARIEALEAR